MDGTEQQVCYTVDEGIGGRLGLCAADGLAVVGPRQLCLAMQAPQQGDLKPLGHLAHVPAGEQSVWWAGRMRRRWQRRILTTMWTLLKRTGATPSFAAYFLTAAVAMRSSAGERPSSG